MRAGTTTLHNILSQLPGLSLPKMKETDFFIDSKNRHLGQDWYQSLFSSSGEDISGEVCPNYAKRDVFPEVPGHVAAVNPNVRLVYIVRDPVVRALSQYKHTWGSTGLPLPDDLRGTWEERHILATSQYAWQLEIWLDLFPREQILIVDFKHLVSDPEAAIGQIAEHIGAEPPEGLDDISRDNSANHVARVPKWWHSLRNTSMGVRARAMAPPGLVGAVKSAVLSSSAPEPPPIPQDMKARFADALHKDSSTFRKLSGMAFDDWSV
ncbi:MAG: sulfotransferase domain-containing protein [Hyphomonadaceae bacterium]|nr:sulfotransferase domain-containing protein [Hyphomonadaceae bacterium]